LKQRMTSDSWNKLIKMTLVLKKIIKEDKPKIKTRADIEMKQVIGLI